MRAFVSHWFVVALVLWISLCCPAQTPSDCDKLRNRIRQVEQVDVRPMSASMREVYKESLLKLYTELSKCLKREIAAVANNGNPALSTLRAEEADDENKIMILRIALNLDDSQGRDVSTVAISPSQVATDVSAVSTNNAGVTASVSPTNANGMTVNTSPPSVSALSSETNAGTPTSAQPSRAMATPANTSDSLQPGCANVLPGEDYPDPPKILSDIVNKAAADVVRRNDSVRAIFPLSQMALYTVFDAASPTSSKMLRGLEAYQYLSETARTDKQLGASAKSEGAVSAIEKPSFARLLGLAVEHGGITKKNDGTNLTLSTSLYSLYAMTGGDTAETYRRAGFLNRIGASATFAVNDQTNDLANARRNNLSEWSVKARLLGDRSTRAASFQRFWNDKIRPLISERLQSLGSAVESLATKLRSYDAIERTSRRCLPNLVKTRMADADYMAATDDVKRQMISALILSHLRSNIFNQVNGGSLKLDAAQVADIEQEFLPRLKRSLDNLVLADAEVKNRIEDLQKGPLGTFAYTNYRIPAGSDYSEAKFLFEQDKSFFRPLKLTGNFGASFYNKPDPSLNQQKLRDVSAALSFEGSSRSPFTEAENQSKITYSFVGRYERLFENRRMAQRKPDIGTFQFVLEIPFFKGLSLPLSATYANATEEEKKNHFRFNFGMRLDTDKLFELLKAGASH